MDNLDIAEARIKSFFENRVFTDDELRGQPDYEAIKGSDDAGYKPHRHKTEEAWFQNARPGLIDNILGHSEKILMRQFVMARRDPSYDGLAELRAWLEDYRGKDISDIRTQVIVEALLIVEDVLPPPSMKSSLQR